MAASPPEKKQRTLTSFFGKKLDSSSKPIDISSDESLPKAADKSGPSAPSAPASVPSALASVPRASASTPRASPGKEAPAASLPAKSPALGPAKSPSPGPAKAPGASVRSVAAPIAAAAASATAGAKPCSPSAAKAEVHRSYPKAGSDWFSKLFGFAEAEYFKTQSLLELVEDGPNTYIQSSAITPKVRYDVGRFRIPRLDQLRERGKTVAGLTGRLRVKNVLGDVAAKHAIPENRYSTFQVASQFNCLEFVGPNVVPEDGITGYINDRTQGPACSIACGPATAYRNYFAKVPPLDGRLGQLSDRMIDALFDVGQVLGNKGQLFRNKGGYTLATDAELALLNARLDEVGAEKVRNALKVGVHSDVQVTSTNWGKTAVKDSDQLVTQVFGSACAVAYNHRSRSENWARFGTLVLEGSYEATLWAALLNADRHRGAPGSNRVFLTCLGGGVFGNRMSWIAQAMRRAFTILKDYDLEVCIVTYAGSIDPELVKLADEFPA